MFKENKLKKLTFFACLFHYIDDHSFEFDYEIGMDLPDLVESKRAWRSMGWEGDGKITVIWVPPFVAGRDDGYGNLVWHVKQDNNGTSYLSSFCKVALGLADHYREPIKQFSYWEDEETIPFLENFDAARKDQNG